MKEGFDDLFRPFLTHYLDSASMLQKFLTAVIVEEWAKGHAERSSEPLLEKSALARDQGATLLDWLQSEPPVAYHEMVFLLSRLHLDCYNLLHSFVTDCKIGIACIPQLGSGIDPTGTDPACFSVHKAREAVGSMFNTLKNSLGRTKKKELAVITERRNTIAANIDRFHDTKAEYDVRISASFAAAYIALRATPEKVSPIVKGIMNGVKVRTCTSPALPTHYRCRERPTSTFKPVPLWQWRTSSASASNTRSNSPQRRLSRICARSCVKTLNAHQLSRVLINKRPAYYRSRPRQRKHNQMEMVRHRRRWSPRLRLSRRVCRAEVLVWPSISSRLYLDLDSLPLSPECGSRWSEDY